MSFQTDSDVGEPWIGVGYKEAGVSPANASMRSEWEVRMVPLSLPGSEVAGKIQMDLRTEQLLLAQLAGGLATPVGELGVAGQAPGVARRPCRTSHPATMSN